MNKPCRVAPSVVADIAALISEPPISTYILHHVHPEESVIVCVSVVRLFPAVHTWLDCGSGSGLGSRLEPGSEQGRGRGQGQGQG